MLFLQRVPELNEIEMQIYRYIQENLTQVCYMRIRELAQETHTSTTTILKFCKKFDCEGYSEFRVKLQIYKEEREKKPVVMVDETAMINFLKRSTEASFNAQIQEAVNLLRRKELLLFLGVGSSNIMAEYGSLYFSSIFNMALRIEDPTNHPIHYMSSKLAQKTCVIALSVSGETKEVIDYLTHINLSNSSVLSITNSAKSTVARLSDVNIPYYISTESNKGADITSQLPALYILERLAKEMKNTQLEE